MRATMLPLRSFGPRTWTSLAGKPASSRRLAIASAATVVLPTESVVLISTSCFKISCESCLVASFTCANTAPTLKTHTSATSVKRNLDFISFPRERTFETSRRRVRRSKRRRRERIILRRFKKEYGVAIDFQFGDIVDGTAYKNLAERGVDDVRLVFRQQTKQLAKTIFSL